MSTLKILSFIIPCYNVEPYIERCYKSLSCQLNAEDVEFIFVNDGSKDNTLQLLETIKSRDDRVILISQENLGVSVARNNALKRANGKYIYLLDSDDYLSSNDIVCKIKSLIKDYNPDLIMPSYNIDVNNVISYYKIPLQTGLYTKYELFRRCVIFPTDSKLIYRTSVIQSHKLSFDPDIKCGEVYAFTVNYLRYIINKGIYISEIPFQNYYMRINSAIHQPNYKNDKTIVKTLHSIYNHGVGLTEYSSFIITAFRLMRSFTYTRYLKYSSDVNTFEIIQQVLSDKIVKRCILQTLYKPHLLIKERLIALYMYIMPQKIGFKLLNYILY